MAANIDQKIALVPNDANIKTFIEGKLALGFVILFMVNLAPVSNNILIVYATPPFLV